MNGFVVLSASPFIYFTCQILDDSLCEATNLAGLQRDPLGEGGGYTPIYGLYRHVPRDMVWFLRFSILK